MERNRDRRSKERLRDAEVSQFEGRQNLLREMDLLRTREQVILWCSSTLACSVMPWSIAAVFCRHFVYIHENTAFYIKTLPFGSISVSAF